MSAMFKMMLLMFVNLLLLNMAGLTALANGNGAFASGERMIELAAASVNDANKHNQMAKQMGNAGNVTRKSFVGSSRVYIKGENTIIYLFDKNGKPFFTPFDAGLAKNEAFYDCMVEGDYGNGLPVTVTGDFKTNKDGTFSVANYATLQCSQKPKESGNNSNVLKKSFVGISRVYTKGENTLIALLDKNGKPFFTPFDAGLSKNEAFYDCMVEGDFGNGDPVTVTGEFKENNDGTFSVANYASLQCSQKGVAAPKAADLEFGRYEFLANGMKTKFVIFDDKVEGKDVIYMMFSSEAKDETSIFYVEGECKKENGTLKCKVDADNEMVKKNNNIFEFAVSDNSLQLTKQIPGMFGKATINQPVFQLKETKKNCPAKTFMTKSATGIYKGVDMLELEGGGEVQIMTLNVDGKEMFINTGDVDVFPILGDKMDIKIAVTYDMVQEWHAMAGTCMKYERLKSLKPLQ